MPCPGLLKINSSVSVDRVLCKLPLPPVGKLKGMGRDDAPRKILS